MIMQYNSAENNRHTVQKDPLLYEGQAFWERAREKIRLAEAQAIFSQKIS